MLSRKDQMIAVWKFARIKKMGRGVLARGVREKNKSLVDGYNHLGGCSNNTRGDCLRGLLCPLKWPENNPHFLVTVQGPARHNNLAGPIFFKIDLGPNLI